MLPQNGGGPLNHVLAFLAIVGIFAIFVMGVVVGAYVMQIFVP